MIYLDSGATTLEKPASVRRAMTEALMQMASPGRGGYAAAGRAAECAYSCRAEAADLFGVPSPEQVVFTMNATHGLNLAIRTLVHPGSCVAISGYEHNAVTRVLHGMENVEILVADGPLFEPTEVLAQFREALDRGAEVVICNHVSNVFGCIQPVEELAALCQKRSVPLIVDASQSAGILPVDLTEWGAAFVAMPGHKGLYGPQGTGLLLCGQAAEPLLLGGTGSLSRQQTMPEALPDRLEAGTHNMPGIAGLLAGMQFVKHHGVERIAEAERRLTELAAGHLAELPGVEVFAANRPTDQTGVLSFRVKGMDSEAVGAALGRRGFALRAGLHCAPLAHRTAGTLETGTIRLSPSVFNRREQVEGFVRQMEAIIRENVKFGR